MPDYTPLTIITDPQLIAIADAFGTATMETSLGIEALLFWYAVLEEIARRDLMSPEARADEADWIVDHLCPIAHGRIVVDTPTPPGPRLPGVSVTFVRQP